MHRVDTPGQTDGVWQDGNPGIGQHGTIMSADWLNDTQENLVRVIEAAEVELIKGDYDQLRLAITTMINRGLAQTRTPVGTVILLDGNAAPAGYLAFDQEYVRATYPDLVAFYVAQGRLIAGSTGARFRTPSYQGRFIRLTSSDATVDPDGPRAAGSLQGDAFAEHSHALPVRSNANSGNGYVEDADSSGTVGSTNTEITGSAETRGKNVALTPFIKF